MIVVEHDEDMIRAADHVIDMGLGAMHSGRVIAQGTFDAGAGECRIADRPIPVGLLGAGASPVPARQKPAAPAGHAPGAEDRGIRAAASATCKNVSVDIPVGLLTCVTGVSGSGKSTLVNDTLYAAVARASCTARMKNRRRTKRSRGIEHFDKVINVDQSPIGRTPRSNRPPTPACSRRSAS